ncbi:MAG: protein translocase subunit SecD [Pirellulales bacterium]|nr:protein translocase subunit SecD [Pirellulales bacterium]
MTLWSSLSILFAQAMSAAPAVAPGGDVAGVPFFRQGWFLWLLMIGLVVGTYLLSQALALRWRMGESTVRIFLVLFSLVAGSAVVFFGWPPKLGIDLKGGVNLVYEIDSNIMNSVALNAKDLAEIERVAKKIIPDVKVSIIAGGDGSKNRIQLDLPAGVDAAKSQELANALADVRPTSGGELAFLNKTSTQMFFQRQGTASRETMGTLVNALKQRVNPGGQKEIELRSLGNNQVEIIIPEADPKELELIKDKISSAGTLEFRIVATVTGNETPVINEHTPLINLVKKLRRADPSLPGGYDYSMIPDVVMLGDKPLGRWVLRSPDANVGGRAFTRPAYNGTQILMAYDIYNVTGEDLSRAAPDTQSLERCVSFTLNEKGARKFALMTTEYTKSDLKEKALLGVILDDMLQTAPSLNNAITSGKGIITGNFSEQEISRIVTVLNSGKLPAALNRTPIQENNVSAQLGSDTIRSGAVAMIVSTLAILIFMWVYYGFCGLVADFAVLLNVILVVAFMMLLKAAFTLAGLAGLVLSVGMAVDANVLIFERMREERARGSSLKMAIRNGFARAMSTVVDSNLTTLVTGVVLFAIGTDQLRGFATTLILGLVLNLFTAVYCSRVIFDVAERQGWFKDLRMMSMLGETNFDFVKPMNACITASLILIGAGLFVAVSRGKDLLDIDFSGGSTVQVILNQDNQKLTLSDVRKLIADQPNLPDAEVSEVVNTAGGIEQKMYKIVTTNPDVKVVKPELAKIFEGKLETYFVRADNVTPYTPPKPKSPAVTGVPPLTNIPAASPAEKAAAEKSAEEKPAAEQGPADKGGSDKGASEKAPSAEAPAQPNPATGNSATATPPGTESVPPAAEANSAEQPSPQQPNAEQPTAEQPPAEQPATDKSATDQPAAESTPQEATTPEPAVTTEPASPPEPATPSNDKSSWWRRGKVFAPALLAVILQAEPAPAADTVPAAPAAASENSTTGENAPAASSADATETPSAETSATETPATNSPAPASPATEPVPPASSPESTSAKEAASPAAETTPAATVPPTATVPPESTIPPAATIPPAPVTPAQVTPAQETTPPAPTTSSYDLQSSVKLNFVDSTPAGANQAQLRSNKISRENLQEIFNTVIENKKLEVNRLEFVSEDGDPSPSVPKGVWTVNSSLPPAEFGPLVDAVKAEFNSTPIFPQANIVGQKVAGAAQGNAIWALVVSMIAIVLYVWFRFQNIVFGFAAVIALIHDVLVTVAFLAFSSYLAPYFGWALVNPFKISLEVVAALLTIVGFSINDTIVIFDRIRELRGKSPDITAEMINKAVNQTLGRTILTSGTVLMVTIILYCFGGEEIHPFSFAMLIGLISGTYSTVYIAAPIILWFRGRQPAVAASRAFPALRKEKASA